MLPLDINIHHPWSNKPSTCRKTLPLSIGPSVRNLTGSGPQHIKIPFWFWNLGDAIEATKSLAGLQCTGNNQRKMTISCKVVPPAKTNEKLAWWNGELPVRYTVGIPATPSHEEVSSPAPQGNWCEIWRKVMLKCWPTHFTRFTHFTPCSICVFWSCSYFSQLFRIFNLQSNSPFLASIIFMGLLLGNRARYCRQWSNGCSTRGAIPPHKGLPGKLDPLFRHILLTSKADGSSWQLLA